MASAWEQMSLPFGDRDNLDIGWVEPFHQCSLCGSMLQTDREFCFRCEAI
jgi:hypothetical protein